MTDPSPTAAAPSLVLTAEQLAVQMVSQPYARARLHVEEVTEEVMVPVVLRTQRARLEYLDLPDGSEPGDPGGWTTPSDGTPVAASPWVTLHTEEPVVQTRRIPVERVRLVLHRVVRELEVQETLRHDEVSLETSAGDPGPSPA